MKYFPFPSVDSTITITRNFTECNVITSCEKKVIIFSMYDKWYGDIHMYIVYDSVFFMARNRIGPSMNHIQHSTHHYTHTTILNYFRSYYHLVSRWHFSDIDEILQAKLKWRAVKSIKCDFAWTLDNLFGNSNLSCHSIRATQYSVVWHLSEFW